jgi:hypothetical protein
LGDPLDLLVVLVDLFANPSTACSSGPITAWLPSLKLPLNPTVT